MRLVVATALLLLAACSDDAPQPAPFAGGDTIECALGGDENFARQCGVERVEDVLVIHHPDGGFRRFTITRDGTGIAAADGADRASVTPRDDAIEVALGGDRYVLPATIAGDAR